MTTTTKTKLQIHMEDKIIDDPELEQALEERQVFKESQSQFRQADKKAKELITQKSDQIPFRIGRFVIAKQTVQSKHVEYDTDEGSRISIKTISED